MPFFLPFLQNKTKQKNASGFSVTLAIPTGHVQKLRLCFQKTKAYLA